MVEGYCGWSRQYSVKVRGRRQVLAQPSAAQAGGWAGGQAAGVWVVMGLAVCQCHLSICLSDCLILSHPPTACLLACLLLFAGTGELMERLAAVLPDPPTPEEAAALMSEGAPLSREWAHN